jgi:hypothetical protein
MEYDPEPVSGSPATHAALATLALLMAGCGPDPRQLEDAVTCYVEAVQDRSGERWLGCAAPSLAAEVLGAPPPDDPAAAAAAVEARLDQLDELFLAQRKSGVVEFSAPDGIMLTRLLSLGRGAYYARAGESFERERARLHMDVRLMYRLIDYPRHRKRGETFWRLGRPLGTLYPIISGMTQMGAREELSRVQVDWDLERGPEGRWRVRAARLLPDTVEYTLQGN